MKRAALQAIGPPAPRQGPAVSGFRLRGQGAFAICRPPPSSTHVQLERWCRSGGDFGVFAPRALSRSGVRRAAERLSVGAGSALSTRGRAHGRPSVSRHVASGRR
jgi:hypothetical protein